jgi:hypothetical protein
MTVSLFQRPVHDWLGGAMFIRPHSLVLITTRQCTAACEGCCLSCGPTDTRRIPRARLIDLVNEASELSSIRTVVFTGGECFLLGEELEMLVAHANGHGLTTRCVTNGYWAVSRQAARHRTSRLARAGLREITFTTGAFHSRYVPVERVVHGVSASVGAGLKTGIYVEDLLKSEFDIDAILKNSELERLVSNRLLKIKRGVWIQDHGTDSLPDRSDRPRFDPKGTRGCSGVLQELAVTPAEILGACCGLHLEKIAPLQFGSLRNASLGRRIREAPDDFLKIWMRVDGPERIWEFVRRHAPNHDWPPVAAHPCETCLRLYQDEGAMRIVRDCSQEVERRIRLKYLTGLAFAAAGHALLSLRPGSATPSPLVI